MSIVQIIGLNELNAKFKSFPAAKAKGFQVAGTNYGKRVYTEANRVVPVRTGRLKRSIGYTINQKELRIFANEDYAGFINFGTSRMPARPFITKPTDDYLDAFVNEYADQLLNHFRG